MTQSSDSLAAALEADARRHAAAARAATTDEAGGADQGGSHDLRLRLVTTFPRLSRPLFAALRATLAPYGYTLSPLHPTTDLSVPRMQTDLARTATDDPPRFAPLVFELEPASSCLRVYVRQFGGRPAPDFQERRLDLAGTPDLAALEAILHDYVRVMIESQPNASA